MKDFDFLKKKYFKMVNKGFPVCLAKLYENDDTAFLTYPLVSEEEDLLLMLSVCLINEKIFVMLEKASWLTIHFFGKYYLMKDRYTGEVLTHSFYMRFHDEPSVCKREDIEKTIHEVIKEYQDKTGYKLKKVNEEFLLELVEKYAPKIYEEYVVSKHALSFDDLLPFLREMEKELPNFHVIDNRNAAG